MTSATATDDGEQKKVSEDVDHFDNGASQCLNQKYKMESVQKALFGWIDQKIY